jgi:tetratricopeptide (TPR) repeat protein
MATVSLQMVFDEARRALEAGAADKAIGIAQHILAHYPRMIEGYRLLGEAYLNASQPEQAATAFEHVLQADPENVAAYYGLGLARQGLDQRSAAITAFERALEIQPNLADLRTQLMRLYTETPGSAGQFRLSRAGLGRLYARGGMFGQAIDEFRAVLDSDPHRDDVKAALAEALWRDGQEDEAMEFCRDVLERQTDLLKPTVLLGYLLFATGQPEGEVLWRRAAEQDAPMAMARSLFDILPPIRLEEPVLPEFDEAEWRAKEARRTAEQPMPVAAVATTDDDFFADSWLSSAGSSSLSEGNTRAYDAPATNQAAAVGGADDDDLLASLLGFAATEPEVAPTSRTDDFEQMQPFGFDWDEPRSNSQPVKDPLPSSLDEVGLHDTELPQPSNEAVGGVKPFSLDDWDFDTDLPTANAPSPTKTNDELDFPDIEAFSLDDDTSGKGGKVQPFSFEAEDTATGVQPFSFEAEDAVTGVKPFAFDEDLGDFGGVAPFSLEQEERSANTSGAAASSDAGLGNVQPFSLDDWGLDDAATGSNLKPLSADELSSPDEKSDDFGNFQPFSLDELSLDSLEDSRSALSGPQINAENEEVEDPSGFSWQEPSWRTQATQSERSESSEGDSIFAKLMRNRSAEQPQQEAEPSASSGEGSGDEIMNFFSLDDEPLRLDADDDPNRWFSDAGAEPFPQTREPESALPTRPSAQEPTQQSDQDQASTDAASFFSLDELEADQGFSWERPAAPQPSGTDAEQEMEPFSLSDLGLTDDELAALDIQSEASGSMTSAQDDADMLPFSLSDLGLSDDELAMISLQESEEASLESPVDQAPTPFVLPEDQQSGRSEAVSLPTGPATEEEPDLTPFSLADFGLDDEELAFLEQAQAGNEAGTASDPATSEFGSLLADLDTSSVLDERDQPTEPLPSANEYTGWQTPPPDLADQAPTLSYADVFGDLPTQDADDQTPTVAEGAGTANASGEEPDLTPFSLADFGLNDEELAFLEQAQIEQAPGTAPGAEVEGEAAAFSETPAVQEPDLTPFSLADFGLNDEELAFLEQAQIEQAPDASLEAEAETTDLSLSELSAEQGSHQDDADAAPAQPESQTPETFESPFSLADLDIGSIQESGDRPTDVRSAGSSSIQPAASEDVSQTETHISDHAMPMDLPEGAQSVASAAEEYHPVQPQAAVSSSSYAESGAASNDLSAVRSMLESDPENDAMRLAVARMSQQTNDVGQAIEHYKHLIKRSSLLDEVVVDLQDTITDTDDPQVLRRLHRLLGDAYMKQNRFREAMDEYSWTLARGR